jgi:hypothetical protein
VAQRHHVRVRAEYFALFRSAMLVDGVLRRLDPALDPIAETRRFMMRNALSRRWFAPAAVMAVQTTAGRAARLLRGRGVRAGIAASAAAAVLAIVLVTRGDDAASPAAAATRVNLAADCELRGEPRDGPDARGLIRAGAVAELREDAGGYWRVRTAEGSEGYLAKTCFSPATALR